jgi:hypothetical protein
MSERKASDSDGHGRDVAAAPLATRILYEDDQVRIWDQRLAPGDSTATHRHEHDYALLDVEGERLEVELLEGPHLELLGAGNSTLELPVKRGQVYWVEKGSVERAVNTGASSYRGILVEVKT